MWGDGFDEVVCFFFCDGWLLIVVFVVLGFEVFDWISYGCCDGSVEKLDGLRRVWGWGEFCVWDECGCGGDI